MRILHLVSIATMTGPADPALKIAEMQRKILGHDAEIAYDTVREGDMPRRVQELGVPARGDLGLTTKGGVRQALADRRVLLRAFADYDVIHAHATHDHGLAALARGNGARAKLIRSIHHPRSAQRRLFQSTIFARTDAFTVVAEAHRQLVLESYPATPPDRVFVVPGAVDPAHFSPARSGEALRRSLGIPAEAFVVGMIARFQAGRRQEVLIEAIAELRRRSGREVWLALIGKGETQAALEAAIAQAGLTAVTRLYGFRDQDLPEAIKSCDLTVLLKEGSDAGCRAVLQSMALGVPVVGARFPAIREAIGEGVAGRLVGGEDSAELAAAIEALWAPGLIPELAAAARQRVLERYTEEQRVRAFEAIYRSAGVTAP